MYKLTKLFEAGNIGKMEVKNRIIMAPAGTGGLGPEGEISDRIIDYYVERAKGGVGFIITQSSMILREALAPSRASMYDDKFVPKLRELSNAVHQNGAKVAFQIAHHGKVLTQFRHSVPNPGEIRALAPSPIPRLRTIVNVPTGKSVGPGIFTGNDVPEEANKEDINCLIKGYAEAARRVKEAGFDAVEIHGSHGYLISQFLSPLDNRRTDEYGGSVENRARFACEVIEGVRKRVGSDFPILFRMNGSDFLEGGITIEESALQAPMFVEAGADALHISAGQPGSNQWQYPSYLFPKGVLVPLAERIRRVVNVPVIAVAKIGDPFFAEEVLRQGRADFIAMARPLMADPELPNKAREGRFDDIRSCVFCLNCLNFSAHLAHHMKWGIPCTVNPAKLREREYTLKPTGSPKKVMVVGGGLAGMEAARVIAERGHQVVLYEKGDQLGGQWYVACQQEEKKGDYSALLGHLTRGLNKARVVVKLNAQVTPELVKEVKPDAVVIATGATPQTLDIEIANGKNVVQAVDVILGKVRVGNKVIVVGGRYLGMEIADDLYSKGKDVCLITRSLLGRDMERNLYLALRNRLIEKGIPIFQNSPLVEIRENGVYMVFNGDLVFLKADTVVMAVGMKSEKELAETLTPIVSELYTIGDCVTPRDAMAAIREGAEIGRKI